MRLHNGTPVSLIAYACYLESHTNGTVEPLATSAEQTKERPWNTGGWGRLTGKIRRDQPIPAGSRLHDTADYGPPVEDAHLYRVVDALDEIAGETGKAIPQIAINWLLQRPTVSSVIIGARNEEQLRQNLGSVGWTLTADQVAKIDAVSSRTAPYPYIPYQRQEGFARPSPPVGGLTPSTVA